MTTKEFLYMLDLAILQIEGLLIERNSLEQGIAFAEESIKATLEISHIANAARIGSVKSVAGKMPHEFLKELRLLKKGIIRADKQPKCAVYSVHLETQDNQ